MSVQIVGLVFITYISTKLIFRCTECKENHKKHFYKDLIKTSENTYECCYRDINRFICY